MLAFGRNQIVSSISPIQNREEGAASNTFFVSEGMGMEMKLINLTVRAVAKIEL
jgi:hypothetical protein